MGLGSNGRIRRFVKRIQHLGLLTGTNTSFCEQEPTLRDWLRTDGQGGMDARKGTDIPTKLTSWKVDNGLAN